MIKRIVGRCLLCLCVLGLESTIVTAEDVAGFPDELTGMLGDWVIEQEDAALEGCAVTLLPDQAIGGFAAEEPTPCPPPFPSSETLAAWSLDEDGNVLLLDPLRHVLVKFLEEEDGLFSTGDSVVPQLYLLKPWQDGDGGEVDDGGEADPSN